MPGLALITSTEASETGLLCHFHIIPLETRNGQVYVLKEAQIQPGHIIQMLRLAG